MPSLQIDLPAWVAQLADPARRYEHDDDRMGLAIALSRESVTRGDGGPFGAAVFECESGTLVSAGINLVVPYTNPVLHAEIVALMLAHGRRRSFSLGASDAPCELFTSCEPCAMCLGAILWSGVRRVVWGAGRADASRIGFDEGPVFPASHTYLAERGVRLQGGVRVAEAREVLDQYARQGGVIYNGGAQV